MKNTAIQEILSRITALIDAEYVYISDMEEDKKLILVLFSEKTFPRQHDHSSVIADILEGQEGFLLRLYTLQYMKKQMREGNLFFIRVCQSRNLVYSNEEHIELPSENIDMEKVMAVAKERFETECTKIRAFREGTDFYYDKEDYPQAAFMLHQSLEIAFRLAEILVTGKEKICHSIAEHQKYVRDFIPRLGILFDPGNEEENRLLQLLDHAYKEVRYGYDYQIGKEELLLLQEKYRLLQTEIRELFDAGIKACETGKKVSGSPEKKSPSPRAVPLSAEEKDEIKRRIEKLIEKKFYKYQENSEKVYYKAGFLLESPLEVLFGVSSLVKVCVMAMEYPEYDLSGFIPQPYMEIKTALELAVQLLPYEEMECLNEIMSGYLKNGVPVV